MRIIIVGCGNIGATIVESLVAEGHDVIAIDEDPNAIAEIANAYDTMGVCGNGVDCETLSEAEVEKAELFVSVTGSDEFNMLSCFLAKRMGAKHTIARIRNPEYNDSSLGFLRNQLDLSLSINPISYPIGVRRTSALSCRRSRRNSDRDVIIRYGSCVPLGTRSSISVPI